MWTLFFFYLNELISVSPPINICMIRPFHRLGLKYTDLC